MRATTEDLRAWEDKIIRAMENIRKMTREGSDAYNLSIEIENLCRLRDACQVETITEKITRFSDWGLPLDYAVIDGIWFMRHLEDLIFAQDTL